MASMYGFALSMLADEEDDKAALPPASKACAIGLASVPTYVLTDLTGLSMGYLYEASAQSREQDQMQRTRERVPPCHM